MNNLTLDQLIEALKAVRKELGGGTSVVYVDVDMGEYKVSFVGVNVDKRTRRVVMYDSEWSDYVPGRD